MYIVHFILIENVCIRKDKTLKHEKQFFNLPLYIIAVSIFKFYTH